MTMLELINGILLKINKGVDPSSLGVARFCYGKLNIYFKLLFMSNC